MFKEQLGLLKKRLEDVFIYKLALAYGVIQENDKKIKFYFEERDGHERGTR